MDLEILDGFGYCKAARKTKKSQTKIKISNKLSFIERSPTDNFEGIKCFSVE